MKLNLSKIRRESEDEQFYHLNDGKPFKVAKAGLSEATRNLIAQHFASGGEVQPLPGEDTAPSFWESIGYKPTPQSLAPPAAAIPEAKSLLQSTPRELLGSALGDSVPAGPSNKPFLQQTPREMLGGLVHPASADAGPASTSPAPVSQTVPDPGMAAQPPAPAAPAPPAAPPGFAMAPAQGISSGRDERDLAAANKDQQAAVAKQAQVATERAQAEEAIRVEGQLKREARMKEIDARISANQARADKLSADIASSQVDPNHFWASKSTGQKVASTIAIILGGLGQGLLRSNSNAVVDLMNKQINDDIEAQRINLGKKQSLLSDYMKAGNDLQQSRELAAADMKDILAGQLAASAAKFGAPEAQALAQQQAASLRQDAVAKRLGVRAQHMDMALKQSALEENRAQAMAAMAKAQQGLKGDPELMVPGVGLALDKEAAKTAREAKAAHDAMVGKLDRLIKLREKYGSETMPGEAKKELESLGTQVMVAGNRAFKLGAMDKGGQEMLGKILGGDATGYGQRLPAMKSLRQSLEDDLQANLRPYMNPASVGGSGYTLRPK